MRTLLRPILLLMASILVALVCALAGSGSGSHVHALLDDIDGDDVLDNTELVTGSNPSDPNSVPEEELLEYLTSSAACDDGIDNDLDGSTDGSDPGCISRDFDPFSDELEISFGSDPDDRRSYPEHTRVDAVFGAFGYPFYETCANENDDDGDGAVDAEDSGCDPIQSDSDPFDDRTEKLFGSDPGDASSVPEHELVNPGSCSDGTDNDRDGALDGADSACHAATNDAFNDARPIAAIPFEDTVKLTSATAELGEPRPDCGESPREAATVWYRYTPATDMALAADTAGSNFPNIVAIWTRNDDLFHEVACAGYGSLIASLRGARASFNASAGETYYIQVIGFFGEEDPADLHLRLEAAHPPANDNFAAASQVTALPYTDALNALDATTEDEEPDGDCSFAEPYSTVWYRYVASANQQVIASTAGSEYPSRISIWTDTPFGLSEIACAGSFGRVAFDLEAGRPYYIQVYTSAPGTASELAFTLEQGVPPANDNFANATMVPSLPFEDTVDLFVATREPGEPDGCAFDEEGNTAWYRVTAQQTGYISASVPRQSSGFTPAAVTAYQGTSLSTLTEVGCADDPLFEGSRALALPVQAGQTYYFQISAFPYDDAAEVTVRFDLLVVPSCATAEFTVRDAPNDPFVFGAEEDVIDPTSVSGGDDGTNYCIRVQFARPLPARGDSFDIPTTTIAFDTDSNSATGFTGVPFPCGLNLDGDRGVIGAEVSARIDLTGQVVVRLNAPIPRPVGGGTPEPSPFGFAIFGQRSLQFILPMDVLGDDEFNFGMSINGLANSDCLPNGGGIRAPDPASLGDINCDGVANSLDSLLILQRSAGLLRGDLLCEYLGDVDQRDGNGAIDAVLILQYTSGLLERFPGDT